MCTKTRPVGDEGATGCRFDARPVVDVAGAFKCRDEGFAVVVELTGVAGVSVDGGDDVSSGPGALREVVEREEEAEVASRVCSVVGIGEGGASIRVARGDVQGKAVDAGIFGFLDIVSPVVRSTACSVSDL